MRPILLRRPLSLVAWLPLLLPACTSVQVEAPAEATLAGACGTLIQERIAYTLRCPGFEPGGDIDAQAAVATCIGVATSPGSLLTVADIDACTQELASACAPLLYPSCAGYGADLLYPNHDKRGASPPGTACAAQLQCDTGYCGTDFVSPCGECKIPRDVGQPCTGPLDVCTGQAQCLAGTCQLPGQAEGTACIDYGSPCQSTLYCNTGGSGLDGVCTVLPGVGAPCPKGSCAGDALCVSGTCAAPLADGASCGTEHVCRHVCAGGVCRTPEVVGADQPCAYDTCAPGLQCSSDPAYPACVPEVVTPKGASCAGAAAPCAAGLLCDATTAVCIDLPGQGQACTSYAACAHGFTCVGFAPAEHQAGICTRLGEVGDPCPCPFELACVGGTCVAFGAATCM